MTGHCRQINSWGMHVLSGIQFECKLNLCEVPSFMDSIKTKNFDEYDFSLEHRVLFPPKIEQNDEIRRPQPTKERSIHDQNLSKDVTGTWKSAFPLSKDPLVPQPASNSKGSQLQNSTQQNKIEARLALSDFDRVTDPFDEAELCTIDVLAELQSVLQTGSTVTSVRDIVFPSLSHDEPTEQSISSLYGCKSKDEPTATASTTCNHISTNLSQPNLPNSTLSTTTSRSVSTQPCPTVSALGLSSYAKPSIKSNSSPLPPKSVSSMPTFLSKPIYNLAANPQSTHISICKPPVPGEVDKEVARSLPLESAILPISNATFQPIQCFSELSNSLSRCSSNPNIHSESVTEMKEKQLTPAHEAKINKLCKMGFARSSCQRAVSCLGNEDRVLVDFLCSAKRISENTGASAEEAEASLLLLKSEPKAVQFVRLKSELLEFGFSSDSIQHCALQTALDREQTIQMLLAYTDKPHTR